MSILGKNNIGSSQFNIVRWWSCKFTATEDGTFTDLNCYFDMTGPGNYKLCIWADSGGNPGTLLFESVSDTHNTTPTWKTRSCNYSFTLGEVMHIGIVADDWMNIYTDTGGTNQLTEFTQDYTGWPTVPNPPTVQQQYNSSVSIYGNYTPGGGVNPAYGQIPSITGLLSVTGLQSITF